MAISQSLERHPGLHKETKYIYYHHSSNQAFLYINNDHTVNLLINLQETLLLSACDSVLELPG